MSSQVLWFRRDLRLEDHPALLRAAASGPVLPLFVLDPALWDVAGPPRRARLAASLTALDQSLAEHSGARLVVVAGDPARAVPEVARATGAGAVHLSADGGPYGRRRDAAVARALAAAGVAWVPTGTPYAIGPGTVRTAAGAPYAVFTPFLRAWRAHGRPGPASRPGDGQVATVTWARAPSGLDVAPIPDGVPAGDQEQSAAGRLDPAGEEAARQRWQRFLATGLDAYHETRDRPDLDGTSSLSAALKFGEIHPRTLLADLAAGLTTGPTTGTTAGMTAGTTAGTTAGMTAGKAAGAAAFETELAWREFYADVLWHRPETARDHLRPEFARMRYDEPGDAFGAWTRGETGFPFVDAGMRQLLAEGWMHNRVRMVVASFLVKDLHVEWQHGARWFMHRLRDGDLASNSHNWQWTAGSGTDAAPYFRVFNPVAQGLRFDPDGVYVRRWVPQLGHLPGGAVHEPWKHPEGYRGGYPARIVEHAVERAESLARYAQRH